MQKAADVMRMWNRSNISKVLSIKPENILEHRIEDIFRSFEEIGRFLHDNKDQLISYGNLISLLNDRKKAIIAQVCKSMRAEEDNKQQSEDRNAYTERL